MIAAREALERLKAGNARFAGDSGGTPAFLAPARRLRFAAAQEPFAIVLGCSDSRVPAELVFDQGLGDLFVIRVAGNVVAPSQVGSVEFAASRFGTPLVVVLGHSQCGAIQAAIEELRGPGGESSRGLKAIVDRVRPSLEGLLGEGARLEDADLAARAVRANIRASVAQLRGGSGILERLILERGLVVVGAEYSLETGEVAFLDGA